MTIETIPVGDSLIEVDIRGSGRSIVLIPGLGVDVATFDDLASRLNDGGYQTIAVNLRGVSGSAGPLDGLTLHDYAADVAGVIDALGIAPSHVLGAAFGNRIARCAARDFPGHIKTVTLISAGGLVQPDPDVLPVFQGLLQNGLRDMPSDERVQAIKSAFFSPATDAKDVKFPEKIWDGAIPAQMRAAQVTALEEWWGGGDAPMLVVQGLDDRIAPPENGRDLKKNHGDRISLVEVADAGHAILDEKPKTVAEAVISYLSEH